MLWVIRVRRDAHPQQKFGIVHLMTRSLSDLLAGGHLAAHCYLPQAYGVLRPVLDSCDLIELFAQDAEQARLWTVTERAHIDFAPARVRSSSAGTGSTRCTRTSPSRARIRGLPAHSSAAVCVSP